MVFSRCGVEYSGDDETTHIFSSGFRPPHDRLCPSKEMNNHREKVLLLRIKITTPKGSYSSFLQYSVLDF